MALLPMISNIQDFSRLRGIDDCILGDPPEHVTSSALSDSDLVIPLNVDQLDEQDHDIYDAMSNIGSLFQLILTSPRITKLRAAHISNSFDALY